MRRDALRNRERLLQAAREVLAEQGHSAGVDEISRRAGVGMGTLYRHFPTKDDLLLTLRQELLEEVLHRVEQTAEEQPVGYGLEACLWTVGAEMQRHHGYLGVLWQAFPPNGDPQRLRFWALVRPLLAEAKAAQRVREDLALTDVFVCILSIRGLMDDTAARAPDAWRRHLALLLAGFRPSEQQLEYPPSVDDSLVESGVPHSSVMARPSD
ncbi:TetR/AcrR family transcriptional regulator [Nocardia sp. NPDC059154]